MGWNYRVCQYVEAGETLFAIREVYYDNDGTPQMYGDASVEHWETLEDVRGTLDLMRGAFDKPVLRLPEDLKP